MCKLIRTKYFNHTSKTFAHKSWKRFWAKRKKFQQLWLEYQRMDGVPSKSIGLKINQILLIIIIKMDRLINVWYVLVRVHFFCSWKIKSKLIRNLRLKLLKFNINKVNIFCLVSIHIFLCALTRVYMQGDYMRSCKASFTSIQHSRFFSYYGHLFNNIKREYNNE